MHGTSISLIPVMHILVQYSRLSYLRVPDPKLLERLRCDLINQGNNNVDFKVIV